MTLRQAIVIRADPKKPTCYMCNQTFSTLEFLQGHVNERCPKTDYSGMDCERCSGERNPRTGARTAYKTCIRCVPVFVKPKLVKCPTCASCATCGGQGLIEPG